MSLSTIARDSVKKDYLNNNDYDSIYNSYFFQTRNTFGHYSANIESQKQINLAVIYRSGSSIFFNSRLIIRIKNIGENQAKFSSNVISEAQNFLNRLYGMKLSNAEILGFLFEEIERAFAKHDLIYVNAILEKFEPNKTKTIISTGLLRVTSRAKKQLSSWLLCASKICQHLDSYGENSKHLLRGLIKFDNAITISSTTIS
jgi:hypothetical protein